MKNYQSQDNQCYKLILLYFCKKTVLTISLFSFLRWGDAFMKLYFMSGKVVKIQNACKYSCQESENQVGGKIDQFYGY